MRPLGEVLPARGLAPPAAGMPAITATGVTGAAATSAPGDAAAALARDLQPHVTALQTGLSPTQRVLAARALAGGRHGSTDTVKTLLLIAAKNDPNPAVRACCIEELAKLGYYDPAFLSLLHRACDDPSAEVSAAAGEALKKLTPRGSAPSSSGN